MKKTPASLRSDSPPAAISETGGRNGTKSLAELSEIPIREETALKSALHGDFSIDVIKKHGA